MPNEETLKLDFQFEALSSLLNGLAEIGSNKEPLIDYAYSMALEAITSVDSLKLLAEAMHKKWLSDSQFPPVAVRLCVRIGDVSVDDACFESLIYSMVYNDYKDRIGLRKISRTLFCNSVHFAFEFMRYFYVSKVCNRKPTVYPANVSGRMSSSRSTLKAQSQTSLSSTLAGANEPETHIYAGMIDPMFDYLHMLIDDIATEQEILLLHYLMFLLGPKLEKLKSAKMHNLMLQIRRKLIDGQLTSKLRALLMELVELQSQKWQQMTMLPTIRQLYLNYRPASYDLGVGVCQLLPDDESDED